MVICPYCKQQIEFYKNHDFCPVCNSYLGDIDINALHTHFVQNAGHTPETAFYSDVTNEEKIGPNYIGTLNLFYNNNEDDLDVIRTIEYDKKVFNFRFKIGRLFPFFYLFYYKNYLEATFSLIFLILISVMFNINKILGGIFFVIYEVLYLGLIDYLIYDSRKKLLKRLKANDKHSYQLSTKVKSIITNKNKKNNILNIMLIMAVVAFLIFIYSNLGLAYFYQL